MSDYDLSGLSDEDKNAIISKLAPSLMQGQGQEPDGDEHSACSDTFQLHQEAILMLAKAMDDMQEMLGITSKMKDIVDTLMEMSDESIKKQEMEEMEEKLGGIYGPYSDKFSTLSPGGDLKEVMYQAIKGLQKRPDYNDGMPEAFVKDKMAEFQKMLDGLQGEAAKPEGTAVKVEKTEVAPVEAAPEAVAEKAPEEAPAPFGLTPEKIADLKKRRDEVVRLTNERKKKGKK